MKQAVILAGGKGTRLATRLNGLPKPLIDVDGIPLLRRQIDQLTASGIDDIVLLVNHRADAVQAFVDGLSLPNLTIRLFDDGEPRGTAGAVLAILDALADRFFVIYGDTLFNVDLAAMAAAHHAANADATLLLHPNDHPHDSDIVETTETGLITRFHPYPHPEGMFLPNLVNAALYIVEKRALAPYRQFPIPADFAKDLLPRMAADGANLFGYKSFEYIKDMGTPERLDKVARALRSGVVARATRRNPQKAVFLDRDGTINVSRGHLNRASQMELLPGVADGIKRLHEAEYRVVVITNQPVVARGEASLEDLRQIHNKMETLLGREHAYIDAIYFCPHHPDTGYVGEIAALKIDCECRKPKTGMVLSAAADMNIDLTNSWMIGDTMRDIVTARRAGLGAVLVTTGEADDGRFHDAPDFVAENFRRAVDAILASPGRNP